MIQYTLYRVFMGTRNVTNSLSQTDTDTRGTKGNGFFIKEISSQKKVQQDDGFIVFYILCPVNQGYCHWASFPGWPEM